MCVVCYCVLEEKFAVVNCGMQEVVKMRTKKVLAWFISAALFLGALTGCGAKEETKKEQPEEIKGRFVQTQQQLPDEWDGWTAKQLFVSDGRLHLLMAKEQGENLALQEWEYQNEKFTDVTREWLQTIAIPAQKWLDVRLMEAGDNTQYLYAAYTDSEEDSYKGHLWRSDGKTARDITPERWTELNEDWGCYEVINGIAALDNGTLLTYSGLSLDTLSGEDGSILKSEQNTGNYYDDNILSDGENLYLAALDNGGGVNSIEKWKGGESNNSEIIPFDRSSPVGIEFCVLPDGTLISAGGDGIFRCEAGKTEWEKLLDGSETGFALTNCWCIGMAALSDGSIHALFQQENGSITLEKYQYDPDAVNEVTEVLKLVAVEESFLLQNAAALYHREHPEVLIELEYAYSYNDKYAGKTLDYNEVYQKLNTMLMGEEAPDILVLDHLDMESYAEKGLLADLQETVAPLEESGEILANVTGAYVREDGRRFTVPMEFGFTFAMGRDISAENMASLKTLSAFLEGKQESYLGAQTVEELVDLFYPYFCGEMVSDGKLNQDILKENLEYLKKIAKNSGVVEKHDDSNGRNGHAYNEWDLASRVKLAFDESTGFNGSMFDVAIVDFIKGDFTAFENCFVPSCLMSVCSKSKYQDTAKDFVRFSLSEAVQGTDYYTGYPVNVSCLEKLSAVDRSDIAACTEIEVGDGGSEIFNINAYPQETADKLMALCRQLDRPVVEDAKIREVLIDELGSYLDGSRSLEDTVSRIEGGLKMYLAE